MGNFNTLIRFAVERENIREKRSVQSDNFTSDPILAKFRFCNIHRRDDRVSKWLLEHYYSQDGNDVWFKAVIARLINWPPTLNYLMSRKLIPTFAGNFKPVEFIDALEDRMKDGVKMYSSAYIVYPTNVKGNSKAMNMCTHIILPLLENIDSIREVKSKNSIELMTKELAKSFGIKTFIAGQVTADLTYISGELNFATDLYSWAPMGPGSMRGLNRLFDRPIKHHMKEDDFLNELRQVHLKLIKEDSRFDDLTLHDAQNVMCEFDKYIRVARNEGTPRQLYKSEWRF
jgi:hypothetical protein